MPKKHSILYNALILTAVNLLLRGVGLVFQIFLSRQVGAAGLGLLQLILTVGGFAMTLGLSGVRTAVMYLCAQEYGAGNRGGVKRALQLSLAYGLSLSTLVGCVLFFAAGPIAAAWIKDPRAVEALRILALSLPLNVGVTVLSGWFTACERIRQLVTVEVAERVLSFLFTLPLLTLWAGNDLARCCAALVLGGSLSTAVSAVWLGAIVLRALRNSGPAPKSGELLSRLLRLCGPLALCEYLRSGLGTLEHFLIPLGLSGSGASATVAMEAYGTIHGMMFSVLMFPAAILYSLADLLIPELARCQARGSRLRVRHLAQTCLEKGFLFSCGVAALMFLCADALGQLLYPGSDVGRYLRIFAPMILMLYPDALVDAMCKGLGQQVWSLRFNILTSALDVLLLFLLLPRMGIDGYILSFFLTHALNFGLSLGLLKRTVDALPPIESIASTCFAALAAFLFCWLLPRPGNLIGIVLTAAAFALVYLPLTGLSPPRRPEIPVRSAPAAPDRLDRHRASDPG